MCATRPSGATSGEHTQTALFASEQRRIGVLSGAAARALLARSSSAVAPAAVLSQGRRFRPLGLWLVVAALGGGAGAVR
jgi:hypothetical protein